MAIYNIKGTKKLTPIQIIIIFVVAIALAPITILVTPALIRLRNYSRAVKYVPTKLNEEYADKTCLIAHRGYRALAPENTIPAYELAGKAGFWGAENDIHRTKDGVWVLQHDYYTFRMMNKNLKIENVSYADLLKLHYDNGSNYKDYPNLKIARLEEYLEKCAEYNMKAIIEIKGKISINYYEEIVELVKQYGVDAQYISFSYETCKRMRELTDAKLFYLTYKIDENAVNNAKSIPNCGVSFDGNDDENKSQEAVNRILDAGLEPALWAIDDERLVESYVDWGVKYITTNQVHY